MERLTSAVAAVRFLRHHAWGAAALLLGPREPLADRHRVKLLEEESRGGIDLSRFDPKNFPQQPEP